MVVIYILFSYSIGGYGSFQDVITLASKMFYNHIFPLHLNPQTTKEKTQYVFFMYLFVSKCVFLDIIKLFNPNLVGAAPGKTVHGMQAHISATGFNLAVTGHNTL